MLRPRKRASNIWAEVSFTPSELHLKWESTQPWLEDFLWTCFSKREDSTCGVWWITSSSTRSFLSWTSSSLKTAESSSEASKWLTSISLNTWSSFPSHNTSSLPGTMLLPSMRSSLIKRCQAECSSVSMSPNFFSSELLSFSLLFGWWQDAALENSNGK